MKPVMWGWLRRLSKLRPEVRGGVMRIVTHEVVPRPYEELWFFVHEDHARTAGFRNGLHQGDRTMRCYTIRSCDPERIRGAWLGKVVITEAARSYSWRVASNHERECYERALELARIHLRSEPNLWIEL